MFFSVLHKLRLVFGFSALFFGIVAGLGAQEQQQKPKVKVDYRSDLSKIQNQGAFALLSGNVAFHHNGVFITCDTAYRFSDMNMEGVGNVIINIDSTFIYGDKFTYDGVTNTAKVYAPIIKTVDKDAVMYTRNMSFNTLDNVGTYTGGGTILQKDNRMESINGTYYMSTRDVVLSGDVEMSSDTYDIKTDSVGFNMDNEVVSFYSRAYIWNHKGEFLMADRGTYDKKSEIYNFTDSAYVMTAEQELCSDTLIYMSKLKEAELRKNIQILDTVQTLYCMGDYGYYWGNEKRIILTDNPSTAAYSLEEPDTTFMRADTMLVLPQLGLIDSLGVAADDTSFSDIPNIDSMLNSGANGSAELLDSLALPPLDSTLHVIDSTLIDSLTLDSLLEQKVDSPPLTRKELKAKAKAEKSAAKKRKKEGSVITIPNVANGPLNNKPDSSATDNSKLLSTSKLPPTKNIEEQNIVTLDSLILDIGALDSTAIDAEKLGKLLSDYLPSKKVDATPPTAKELKEIAKEEKRAAKKLKREQIIADMRQERTDSLSVPMADSLAADSLDSIIPRREESVLRAADSSDYVLRGFYNVKIFGKDMSAVCDSIVGITLDSTLLMYNLPILWSGESQITASYIKLYTKNQHLDRAELYDFPITAQRLNDKQYNQVRGKYMEAYFKNDELDIVYIDGNAETLYYREEDGEINSLFEAASANMEITFDSMTINRIKWISDVNYKIIPIDLIPSDQKLYLEGFEWLGEYRPASRYDVCDRTIRPKRRSMVATYIKPLFPITEIIDQEKIKLSKEGLWYERNEPLPIDKAELVSQDF